MLQIIKRLELIKTSISLEDEEIIEMQVNKIKSLDYDTDIASILNILEQNDFANALSAIEFYINKHTGLIPFEDKEVQGLKLELKVLERKLQNLTEKKNDYTIDIDDFNREYSLRLGAIIQKVLSLREEILYQQVVVKEQKFETRKDAYDEAKSEVEKIKKRIEELENELEGLDEFSEEYDEIYDQCQKLKEELSQKEQNLNEKRKEAKQAKEELDDDPVSQEYQEAKDDSETFEREYEEVIAEDTFDLDKDQQKELKIAFRRASRLCHPDIVSDELKDQAHKIMSELNVANKRKDLDKVKEILHSLQSGIGFDVASDTIFDKDLLKTKIANTKKRINLLSAEINELLSSDVYKDIQDIEDKNEYFDEVKNQLDEELERLAGELRQLKSGSGDDFNDDVDEDTSMDDLHAYENMMGDEPDEYWEQEF